MDSFRLFVVLLLIFVAFSDARFNQKDSHDKLIRKSRQTEEENGSSVLPITPATQSPLAAAEVCSAQQCNNRGTCFGTKAFPFCFCQLGYAGSRCQDSYCDSARDCNGRGWCMGTSSQYTCLCNIGFTGTKCEQRSPPTSTSTTTQRSENNRMDENIEEQI